MGEGRISSITDRIAAHNLSSARRVFNVLNDEIESIARLPLLHRLRQDVGQDARVAPVGDYLILYRVVGTRVRIERVIHGKC